MRTLLLTLAALALVADGYVHGLWTDRWGNSQALKQALARLNNVPLAVGEWRGQKLRLREREVTQAGFSGYLLRRYERPDGSAVSVLLACGRAGPLSVHTPEVCYAGAGFTLAGKAVRQAAGGGAAFWKGRFSKQQGGVHTHLRVLWSWHTRGAWQAPDSLRLEFGGLPVLHKMYLTCEMPGGDEKLADAACAEFMGMFLPALEKTLFAEP